MDDDDASAGASGGKEKEDEEDEDEEEPSDPSDSLWAHPYGRFPPKQAFIHIDRVGFRVPDKVSEAHATEIKGKGKGKGSKKGNKGHKPLQRSLTPHLDCCPHQVRIR